MNKKSIYFKILPVLLCTTLLYSCTTNSTSETNGDSQTIVMDGIESVVVNNTSISLSDVVTYDGMIIILIGKVKIQIILI